MSYKDIVYNNTEDVDNENNSYITFTKKKTKIRIRYFIKAITLILIAATSGAISGAYIVKKQYSSMVSSNYFNGYNEASLQGIYSNAIKEAAEDVMPSLVGIGSESEDLWIDSDKCATGIIFSTNGYIVTSGAIVEGKSYVNVRLFNGKLYKGKVVGGDTISGLSIIKINEENLPTVSFANSSEVNLGDVAIAIGNPLGEKRGGLVTAGIVSALNKKIILTDISGKSSMYEFLQTDAGINKGNKYGVICSDDGKILGINSTKTNNDIKNKDMAYILSSNDVKRIAESVIDTGYVSRATMGICGGTAIPGNNNPIAGVYVQQVIRNSGASKAGIRPTDIIISLDNININNMEELIEILQNHKGGEVITCTIWRGGKTIKTNVKLYELNR